MSDAQPLVRRDTERRRAPAVTVVIAAYNCGPWIGSTVRSVLDQSYENLELIVVDDGSTDDTTIQVNSVTDGRLRYVHQPNSGSPAKPRNLGLRLARAQYVSFLDHDDRWYRTRLGRVMECFTAHPQIDVVCHDEQVVGNGRQGSINMYGPTSETMYLDMLLHGNRLSTSATTVKTDLVRKHGGFDERREFFTAEDFDLWLRLARNGSQFLFLHETLGEYTLSGMSMTANIERHCMARRAVCCAHLEAHAESLETYRRRILGNSEYAFARALHRSGQHGRALGRYRAAMREGFVSARLLVAMALALARVRV